MKNAFSTHNTAQGPQGPIPTKVKLTDELSSFSELPIKVHNPYKELTVKITKWKKYNDGTEDEYDEALGEIGSLRDASNSSMCNDIETLKVIMTSVEKSNLKMVSEIVGLNKTINGLSEEYGNLTKNNMQSQYLMIIRNIATSVQHAMTVQFPGAFGKHSYSVTFNNIKDRVKKVKKPEFDIKLAEITSLFTTHGVDEDNISYLIKDIRELGTGVSHPTTIFGADGVEYVPDAKQLAEIINEVKLSEELKVWAKVLLDVLVKLVPPGQDLLFRIS